MTSLLSLAREHLERTANPAFGVAVNDDHGALLAQALQGDDRARFASEISQLDDPDALTSYGWSWILQFADAYEVPMDGGLLVELCRRWDEPSLKALVIGVALADAGDDLTDETRQAWVDAVVEGAAPASLVDPDLDELGDRGPNRFSDDPASDRVDTSSAEALLTAFLVVGTPAALRAARQLIGRPWPGSADLEAFVAANLEDPDPLVQAPWRLIRE